MEKHICQYIFNCPIHGDETGVFCWRAFSPELHHLWKKYEVILTEIPITQNEIDKLTKISIKQESLT